MANNDQIVIDGRVLSQEEVDEYSLPYERGQWFTFYRAFLQLVDDYKLAIRSVVMISSIMLVPLEEEAAYDDKIVSKDKNGKEEITILPKTAFIDGKNRIKVFESFLLDNNINSFEFCAVLVHEILHYALGHLDEYERLVKKMREELREEGSTLLRDFNLQNIICDAVINSLIHKTFKNNVFSGFFKRFYEGKEFPFTLLRPDSDNFPSEYAEEVYERLFEPSGATMYEVRSAIEDCGGAKGNETQQLMGGHGMSALEGEQDSSEDGDGPSKEDFRDAAKSVAQDTMDALTDELKSDSDQVNKGCDPYATQQILKQLKEFINTTEKMDFNHEAMISGRVSKKMDFKSALEKDILVLRGSAKRVGVIRTAYDRKQGAYKAMKLWQAFFAKKVGSPYLNAAVYFDSSGSCHNYIPTFMSAIRYNQEDFSRYFTFSTYVFELDEEALNTGKYSTSGGTNDCWAHHMLENDIKYAVIMTDGQFYPSDDIINKFTASRDTKIIVVFTEAGRDISFFKQIPFNIKEIYTITTSGSFEKVEAGWLMRN